MVCYGIIECNVFLLNIKGALTFAKLLLTEALYNDKGEQGFERAIFTRGVRADEVFGES